MASGTILARPPVVQASLSYLQGHYTDPRYAAPIPSPTPFPRNRPDPPDIFGTPSNRP